MEKEHFFIGLDGWPRTAKPRSVGKTMVVDWGIGRREQEDLIETAGPYFDFAKIAVGMSRMYTNALLRTKLEAYRAADIEPFPGGQFLEYAEIADILDRYLPACVEAGFRWVEVSDNVVDVNLDWKVNLIGRAVTGHGLKVFGEVGKKEGLAHGPSFLDDAQACLDAGASIILLEAAELVSGDPDTMREVEAVVDVVGLDRVMFELPGPWIAGVNAHDVHKMRRDLIDRYGSEVNVGNVTPDELFSFEAYRRGLGVNAGKAQSG